MPKIKLDTDYVSVIIRIPKDFYYELKDARDAKVRAGKTCLLHDNILGYIKKGYGKK